MHTLYLLGGVSQVGKSKVATLFERQTGIQWCSTDGLRWVDIAQKMNMEINEFAWNQALEMIKRLDVENTRHFLLEGIAVTPERVHVLKPKNFSIRAAFIGYSDASYASIRLAHKDDEGNWLGPEMRKVGRGDTYVTDGIGEEIKKSLTIERNARRFGYKYFDASKIPDFDKRNQAVINYLLE